MKREARDSCENVGGQVLLAFLCEEEGTVIIGVVPTDAHDTRCHRGTLPASTASKPLAMTGV